MEGKSLRPLNHFEMQALHVIKDRIKEVQKLIEYGHTEKFVMELLDIDSKQWGLIQRHLPEFESALKKWKLQADTRVEAALYERAIGYAHPETIVKVTKEGDVIREDIIKRYPPDVTAAIFWLKNRKPEAWKEKVEVGGQVDHRHLHLVSEIDIDDRIAGIAKESLSKDCLDALS